ncbi:MAG: hypothetical protein QFE16_16390, partial [Pseudomonadota bacterium]|nr:hypothetical protein [Pseudomonadota bacterium]
HALVVLNLLLAGVLVWLWVDQDGQLRNVRWTPPLAIKPDFSTAARASSKPHPTDMTLVLATLERPLFSPSRRPPPPVVAAPLAAEPVPDPLGNVLIQGIYSGTETGGIIANVGGISRRISINEKIGDWTLKSIDERDVKFVRNDESRVVQLLRARPAPTAAASPNNPTPQSGSNAPQSQMSIVQKMEDEARDLLRRRNELRARAGRPPIAP